ncbi:MAG: hypothetical protein LBI06_07730 [Treponema sp.]|jgi:hypothetical protein|nr:hypothetical protein [Treponema sp.]
MRFTAIAICAAFLLVACATTPKEEPFSVDLDSPNYEVSVIEAYSDRYMSIGSLKKSNVTVYYYPAEDAVCLQFKIQFADCKQFWDKAGRAAFTAALERYKEDYEQRKLTKGSKKTARKVYGSTQGFFAWKKTKVGVQAHGSPKIEFGYNIKDGAAFFTTTQLESYYIDPIGRSRNQTSPVIMLYFTRAQAESLAALFDQDHLQGPGRMGSSSADDTDEYMER